MRLTVRRSRIVVDVNIVVHLLLVVIVLLDLTSAVTGRGAVTLGESIVACAVPSRVVEVRVRRGSKEVVGVLVALRVSFHRWSHDTRFPVVREESQRLDERGSDASKARVAIAG